MKAVVASSRLGNHGHHDGSRNGRHQDTAKDTCLAQGAGSPLLPEDNPYQKPSETSLQSASVVAPPVQAEKLDTFQTEHPMAPAFVLNGAGCKS